MFAGILNSLKKRFNATSAFSKCFVALILCAGAMSSNSPLAHGQETNVNKTELSQRRFNHKPGSSLSDSQPCGDNTDPCFENVGDYLEGVRQVLPFDDLFYLTNQEAAHPKAELHVELSNAGKFLEQPAQALGDVKSCHILRGPLTARFFNTTNDWIVGIQPANNDTFCGSTVNLTWQDPLNAKTLVLLQIDEGAATTINLAAFDLNQDGYADVVVSDKDSIRVYTAVDVNDPTKGLVQAAKIVIPGEKGTVAIGDFNLDGAVDIIVPVKGDFGLFPSWNMYGFSVCSYASAVVLKGSRDKAYPPFTCGRAWDIYKRGNGEILAEAFGAQSSFPVKDVTQNQQTPRLVAGDFLGHNTGQSQLFASLNQVRWTDSQYPEPIDSRLYQLWQFDAELRPTLISKTRLDFVTYNLFDIVRKARLHSSGSGFDRDQVILYASSKPLSSKLQVITFDDLGTLKIASELPIAVKGEKLVGLATGRFDPPKAGNNVNFDQKIAVLLSGPGVETRLYVYSADQAWNLNTPSNTYLGTGRDYQGYGAFDNLDGMLRSGDAQGRSLLLGAPIKVIVEDNMQPDLVLAIPPMHIDYIRDASGAGPKVLNLTVFPATTSKNKPAFNTQYAFTSGGSTAVSESSTTDTGDSIGIKNGTEISFGFGDIKKNGEEVRVGYSTAIKKSWENSNETRNSHYSSKTNSLEATTGFADHIYFTTSRLNVYYYPVLGKRCPVDNPKCTNSEKEQQYVQYSAPDLVERSNLDATTQEWYQPVQEPGNIFSYPWNIAQMKFVNPSLKELSNNNWQQTDTAIGSVKTSWATGGETGVTTGSVTKMSVDSSLSASGEAHVDLFVTGGVKTSVNLDYGNSDSVKTMNSGTTSLSASTGILLNKPGFRNEVATKYFYYFNGAIFGQNPQESSFTEPVVNQSNGKPVDQQFFGPLIVAFAADPFHGNSQANWWRAAYQKPDIGLNHPSRWSWDTAAEVASFNFRDSSTVNPPATILSDVFYHMKGLFIGKASDDPNASPQLSTATAGESLRLRARVYNFSVADMPEGSQARVRFYGQVYDQKTASLSGDGFLIGEDSVGTIPGFNSPSNQGTLPNWKMASTTFDTTEYAGKFLVFWVVVWGENANGNLLEEQEGHGLKQNPADATFKQITDVPVEDYSNNVGMYGTFTPFFVAPQDTPVSSATAVAGNRRLLRSDDVLVEASRVNSKSERSWVTVTVHNTTGGRLSAVPVIFYDGDPAYGGKAFDLQRIPNIEADDTYALRTFLQPNSSGHHELFVQVGTRGFAAPVLGTTSLDVP